MRNISNKAFQWIRDAWNEWKQQPEDASNSSLPVFLEPPILNSPIKNARIAWRSLPKLQVAGIAYIWGLVFWTFAAYMAELGFIVANASNAQIVIAGFIPGLMVGFFYLVFRSLVDLPAWTSACLNSLGPQWVSALLFARNALFVSSIVAVIAGSLLNVETMTAVAIIVFFVSLYSLLFIGRADRFQRIIFGVSAILFVVLFVVWMGLGYVIEVYPRLPQAFGGGRPECFDLDIQATRFTANTLENLGLVYEAPRGSSPVTARLYVLFRGGDSFFVSPDSTIDPTERTVIELRGDVVQAMSPCAGESVSNGNTT